MKKDFQLCLRTQSYFKKIIIKQKRDLELGTSTFPGSRVFRLIHRLAFVDALIQRGFSVVPEIVTDNLCNVMQFYVIIVQFSTSFSNLKTFRRKDENNKT